MIDTDAITTAEQTFTTRMQEYMDLLDTGTQEEIRAAWCRYKEASSAYITLINMKYNL